MKIHLAYGKDGLAVDIPDRNLVKVLSMKGAPVIADPGAALRTMLETPIGRPSLRTMATGKNSACIVICDITRPVPNRMILPPVLETLEQSGVPRGEITILIATGLHRASTETEVEAMVGPDIARQYRVVSHHARALTSNGSWEHTAWHPGVY